MPDQSVLIADNDRGIRVLVTTLLRLERFDVDEAGNGQETIERLRAKRYDALVLDLMMGPGNGQDVLDEMKIQRPGEKFVVVISATSQAAIDTIAEENICAKLRKPFDIHKLVQAIRKCVGHEVPDAHQVRIR